jgi:hypothetical protein
MNGTNGTNGRGPMFTLGGKPGPGRPTRQRETETLAALKQAWPAERLMEALDVAYDLAVATNSWRGVVAVTEMVLNHQLGKPRQRIENAGSTDLAQLLGNVDTSKPLMPDFDEEDSPL